MAGRNRTGTCAPKIETILVSSRKVREVATINVGQQEITSKAALKYLGIMFDARLTFKTHIDYAVEKAEKVAGALTRVMLNVGGPKQQRRQLYASVVRSVLLYGAQIWYEAFSKTSYVREARSLHRFCAIKVCSAFRTTSEEAALVVAGLCPIDILVEVTGPRPINRTRREEVTQRCLQQWQTRWDRAASGRWTHRLIPSISRWVSREHGEVDFHLTQILTGHGCFKSYLYRFKHEDDPFCTFCAKDIIEDAEHCFSSVRGLQSKGMTRAGRWGGHLRFITLWILCLSQKITGPLFAIWQAQFHLNCVERNNSAEFHRLAIGRSPPRSNTLR